MLSHASTNINHNHRFASDGQVILGVFHSSSVTCSVYGQYALVCHDEDVSVCRLGCGKKHER